MIVLLRGNHAVIVLEPRSVRGGEVHLRDDLDAHSAQTVKFGTEFLNAPAPLYGQFRMAGVLHDFCQINDDLVAASLGKGGGNPAP